MINQYLHFRPTFEGPMVYEDKYYDIADSDLCIWNIENFKLLRIYPKISEAYYIKLKPLSN